MIYQNELCCFLGGRLLVLRAVDVASEWQWRWLLSDEESGQALADHAVELDPASDEVAAFGVMVAAWWLFAHGGIVSLIHVYREISGKGPPSLPKT